MATSSETKRLPSSVAIALASVSLVLGVTAAEYLGTGPIGAVVGTLVLMLCLALAYEFIFER